MLFFFRDPEMTTPDAPDIIVAAASGRLAKIAEVYEGVSEGRHHPDQHLSEPLRCPCEPFPISGQSAFLGYFPGEASLHLGEVLRCEPAQCHPLSSRGGTRCLIRQIVGPCAEGWSTGCPQAVVPVKRGAVRHDEVRLEAGYVLSEGDVEMTAKIGQKVTAGGRGGPSCAERRIL